MLLTMLENFQLKENIILLKRLVAAHTATWMFRVQVLTNTSFAFVPISPTARHQQTAKHQVSVGVKHALDAALGYRVFWKPLQKVHNIPR